MLGSNSLGWQIIAHLNLHIIFKGWTCCAADERASSNNHSKIAEPGNACRMIVIRPEALQGVLGGLGEKG